MPITVSFQNALHQEIAPDKLLAAEPRFLSDVLNEAGHDFSAVPAVVCLIYPNTARVVSDQTVVLRKEWGDRLVGPDDTILIVILPRGGGGGGGQNTGKAIGAALATIALTAVAGPIGSTVAGALFTAGTLAYTVTSAVVSLGIIMGGSYLLSEASKPKSNTEGDDNRPLYGVSGGGNQPRTGDRIPVIYGRTWTVPDLSQPDYSVYSGEDQILFKRMTLGLGQYDVYTIRVGDNELWNSADGVSDLFPGAEVEVIAPGNTSALVPDDVITASSPVAVTVPYADDDPAIAGPFVVSPTGVNIDQIQIDYTFPEGVGSISNKGSISGALMSFTFEYAPINSLDEVTGAYQTLYSESNVAYISQRPLRFTKIVSVPEGRYVVRAKNLGFNPGETNPQSLRNSVQWDALRGYKPDTRTRSKVTELALKITSGKELGYTTFSDVQVEVQRKLPVWNGSAWTAPTATSKAVWAFADVLRNTDYGASRPDSEIDAALLKFYADNVSSFDEFNGIIRGPVSVYEAATAVLFPLRAEPLYWGRKWSIVRDEPTTARRRLFTRRQIVEGSTSVEYIHKADDGA